jgi:hypothetical protein
MMRHRPRMQTHGHRMAKPLMQFRFDVDYGKSGANGENNCMQIMQHTRPGAIQDNSMTAMLFCARLVGGGAGVFNLI